MVINHNRDKLFNAVIYFANNTKYFGKIKLCKLLYFLDFEHFKQTGRSVTGLDYFAWPKGPVPKEFYDEIESPKEDLINFLQFHEKPIKAGGSMLVVTPLKPFNPSNFSNRELKILEGLAKEFYDTYADDMVEATHLENQPWHKIYVDGNKKQTLIPYELALRKQETSEMTSIIKEREKFINHFG